MSGPGAGAVAAGGAPAGAEDELSCADAEPNARVRNAAMVRNSKLFVGTVFIFIFVLRDNDGVSRLENDVFFFGLALDQLLVVHGIAFLSSVLIAENVNPLGV